MSYEKITTKILGEHTEREGEVASLVLSYVAKNPDWAMENENSLYEDRVMRAIDLALCQLYHRPLEYYLDKSREAERVEVRQMVCLYLRENTNYSYPKIGRLVKRDHATAIFSVNTAKDSIAYERSFRENYETLKNNIKI